MLFEFCLDICCLWNVWFAHISLQSMDFLFTLWGWFVMQKFLTCYSPICVYFVLQPVLSGLYARNCPYLCQTVFLGEMFSSLQDATYRTVTVTIPTVLLCSVPHCFIAQVNVCTNSKHVCLFFFGLVFVFFCFLPLRHYSLPKSRWMYLALESNDWVVQ